MGGSEAIIDRFRFIRGRGVSRTETDDVWRLIVGKLKRKANGICIFCGAEGEVTDEHIFPESWYPDDTPPNTAKWKAPSCYQCNHVKYAPIETLLFPFLATTAEPDRPGAKGIADRGFGAANEHAGKKPKDKAARASSRADAQAVRSAEIGRRAGGGRLPGKAA